ncbi:MAG: protoporphyrin IX magnesium-chelatase [Candidatus Aramenus sulfurataquae]|uniref:Protoporphyrin IX magnesium-chelatase n=1 Tax=Candidatus Aramenus sulfurataquae TaxID=1326980 RepID=W7KY18_9CREN|nr:MAG: protoporphyrin IX magnesium-chelatase [Candidatus Aramenus sulfurataquae]
MVERNVIPFSAIIGQERLKKALMIVAVNPSVGGLLIMGPKGVAKSTAVRALANLLPEIEVVADCPFSCDPRSPESMCDSCRARYERGEKLPVIRRKMRIVELPVSATLDRVVGSLDIKKAIEEGLRALSPGLLAEANRGILYIDEVNLLPDDIVNAILDSAASKVNVVEREGVSVSHPANFILIGTMNPEEGELRPQLLDRFGISVVAESPKSEEELVQIAKVVEEFEANPKKIKEQFEPKERELRERITRAREILREVEISDDLMRLIAKVIIKYSLSNRAMIATVRVAKTIAALDGRKVVSEEDVKEALEYVLPHRLNVQQMQEEKVDVEKVKKELEEILKDDGGNNRKEEKEQREEKEINVDLKVDSLKSDKSGRGGISRSTGNLSSFLGKVVDFYSTIVNMALSGRKRITREDVSLKELRGRGSVPILVLLDTSRSMNLGRRISIAKKLSKSLLNNAYKLRSKVGLITFSGYSANYVVRFSKNFSLIDRSLNSVKPQGRTPLSHAIYLANKVLKKESMYSTPITFIITDGKANVSLNGNIREELERLSYELGKMSKVVVVDANTSQFTPSYNQLIARSSNARIISLNQLSKVLNDRAKFTNLLLRL